MPRECFRLRKTLGGKWGDKEIEGGIEMNVER